MNPYTITNKNTLRIISILKSGKLYFNQIAELSGIKSRNNLLKNLSSLVAFNIVIKEQNKSNTFYSINYENLLAISMLNLVNLIQFSSLPFERRKSIEEAIKRVKPEMAVLFGSTAKKSFKKESDIDLLFVFNQENKNCEKEAKEIASRYGVKISLVSITFNHLDIRNETIKHILKTGCPLTGEVYFYELYKEI